MDTDPVERLAGIVILAYNRPIHLARVLEGLVAQDIGAKAFRVIVVDNGSSPPLDSTVERFREVLDLIQVRIDDDISRAAARNRGIERVTEPVLILLDGDTVPDTNLVREHLRVLEDPRVVVSLGSRRETRVSDLSRADGTPDPVAPDLLVLQDESRRDIRLPEIEEPTIRQNFDRIGYFFTYTHNLAARSSVVRAFGGFNDDLGGYGLEDLEFGFRIREAWSGRDSVRWTPTAGSVHLPHLRDLEKNASELQKNQLHLLDYYRSFHWEGHRFASPYLECLRILMLEEMAASPASEVPTAVDPAIEGWIGATVDTFLLGVGPIEGFAEVEPQNRSVLTHWRDRSRHSLCGTQIPVEDGSRQQVVNVDIWRSLPWHHVSEALSEARRVAGQGIFVATARHDEHFERPQDGSVSGSEDTARFDEDVRWLASAAVDIGLRAELKRTATSAAVRIV